MPPVFVEDQAAIVHEHPVTLSQTQQGRDTSFYTLLACLRCPAICDDCDVGIHHHGRAQAAPFFFRFSTAWLMAAISPNSSPKKSFGQFLMFPKRSRSKGIK